DPRGKVPADLPRGRPYEPLELGASPPRPGHSPARDSDRHHAAPRPRLPAPAVTEIDRKRARAVLREGERSAEGHEPRAVGTAGANDPPGSGAQGTDRATGRAGCRLSSVARGPAARGRLPQPRSR